MEVVLHRLPMNDKGVHPINKGKGADLGDIATIIDLQARHCTTLQFRGGSTPVSQTRASSMCRTCVVATDCVRLQDRQRASTLERP